MPEMNHESIIHERVLEAVRQASFGGDGPVTAREVYEAYTDLYGAQSTAVIITVLGDLTKQGKLQQYAGTASTATSWLLVTI